MLPKPHIHTSSGPDPQIALKSSVELPVAVHASPSYRRIVPLSPTAHASVGLAAHTPRRCSVVGDSIAVQTLSRRRRIVPSSPTAKTVLRPAAHTLLRSVPGTGDVSTHHSPTGHVSGGASGSPPSPGTSSPPSVGAAPGDPQAAIASVTT